VRTRKRYSLDRVTIAPLDSRQASWTFAGEAVRGIEYMYHVTDGNLTSRNQWQFVVRVPEDPKGRIEVRPRTVPPLTAWAELPDRSLTFMPATRESVRGRWYCQVALADVEGERSKAVVPADKRTALPHWFSSLSGRMRRKEAVKPTRGTDGNALVILIPAGDHTEMIRLFFATKVWILSERIVV
jgi:hypothetical protein